MPCPRPIDFIGRRQRQPRPASSLPRGPGLTRALTGCPSVTNVSGRSPISACKQRIARGKRTLETTSVATLPGQASEPPPPGSGSADHLAVWNAFYKRPPPIGRVFAAPIGSLTRDEQGCRRTGGTPGGAAPPELSSPEVTVESWESVHVCSMIQVLSFEQMYQSINQFRIIIYSYKMIGFICSS